jgi:hypothetical protein
MAGESAHEMARRAKDKAQRLESSAARWEAGSVGEAATAAALEGLPSGWSVWHDVRWPGRQRANVDHIVLGPGGVFVIDSKNWTGDVTLSLGVLRQNGRSRENAVASAADAALAVAQLVGRLAKHVEPVLCFTDRHLAGRAREVAVCGTGNLQQYLLSRPVVLSERQISDARRRIDRATSAATSGRPSAPRTSAAPRPRSSPRRRQASPARVLLVAAAAVSILTFGRSMLLEAGAEAAKVIVPESTCHTTCTQVRPPHQQGQTSGSDAQRANAKQPATC